MELNYLKDLLVELDNDELADVNGGSSVAITVGIVCTGGILIASGIVMGVAAVTGGGGGDLVGSPGMTEPGVPGC